MIIFENDIDSVIRRIGMIFKIERILKNRNDECEDDEYENDNNMGIDND